MKNILVLAAVLALAAPLGGVAPAFADSSNDRLCGPDAPEGYKRPGGYCDQIDSKGSLFEQKDCNYDMVEATALQLWRSGAPVLVAENCYEPVNKKLLAV